VRDRSFGLLLVAAFALGTGLKGLYSGATALPGAPNTLATVVGVLNLTTGIAGILAAVLVWRQDRRATVPLIAWGASVIGAALLAPLAYAPNAGWPAALVGGVPTAAVVVTIVLYVRWRLGLTALGESSPAS
jgi:uncharacterized membrane protein YeaQ/YmgE (transglycosylase-associated protein family)